MRPESDRSISTVPLTREELESFLYTEARLLDDWRLPEWVELFTEDGRYLVPPVGIQNAETADPDKMLFLVADDRLRLNQRVARLMKKSAHAEYPHSRTRHTLTNIEIRGEASSGVNVSAYFVTYRIRRREVITYMGQVFYTLARAGTSLKIRERRACLDLDALKPQGTLAFIL